jgi:sterol desaturase/sphingolipid hydroxylase (fatty acid hydroxylase superfamily)
MSYMSIVLTNQVEDNAVNNIMYDFVVVGGGNAIWRMLNRNCVTAVKRMLSLTNLSMVLSCSAVTFFALAMAVTLFALAMAVIYQLLC